MATAEKVVIPPVEPEVTYTLTLDADEAQVIYELVGEIGGGRGPLREAAISVSDALSGAGVRYVNPNPVHLDSGVLRVGEVDG